MQVILMDPIVSANDISKVSVRVCNALGCSIGSAESSWTSLSINADSEVLSVFESHKSSNMSFILSSSVGPGDGNPQKTILYWEAVGNVSEGIADSLLSGKILSGNLSFGYQSTYTVALSNLEFLGIIKYKFFKHCSAGIGGIDICGSEAELYTTTLTFQPHAPNLGGKVAVSAPDTGGRIRLDFLQTDNWGSKSFVRGRQLLLKVNLGNKVLSDKYFVQAPDTATGVLIWGRPWAVRREELYVSSGSKKWRRSL